MTATDFLKYEASLLLARYGRDAVLRAMAEKLNCSQTELESALAEIERQRPAVRRSRAVASFEAVESIVREHPAKAKQLRSLHDQFQNRTFLPELRDVRRFFEEHSQNLGHEKSRAASLPRLLRLLGSLDPSELDLLREDGESGTRSSLGIISDAILGRGR